ncbi:hypothetical protein Q8A67_025020 [Cirrhinus molitorella]|uniref:Uncharacterized protein n=1 Tax=Cirrhinus molitorella TaxID=172907 RepID=A0AA88NZ15_9TELE|nr:hypothetical protein Q8A67_025020 [Cirrhinus molitorella]
MLAVSSYLCCQSASVKPTHPSKKKKKVGRTCRCCGGIHASVFALIYETHINPGMFVISIQSGDTFMNSPPKISDLAVNLTLTALQSLPQTNAEIEVLLFDVVVGDLKDGN